MSTGHSVLSTIRCAEYQVLSTERWLADRAKAALLGPTFEDPGTRYYTLETHCVNTARGNKKSEINTTQSRVGVGTDLVRRASKAGPPNVLDLYLFIRTQITTKSKCTDPALKFQLM